MNQSKKDFVKLSIDLISTLNHLPKEDYLKILNQFFLCDNEGNRIINKENNIKLNKEGEIIYVNEGNIKFNKEDIETLNNNYQLKKIYWNEDLSIETDFCLINNYRELLETDGEKNSRYLKEHKYLKKIKDLSNINNPKDLSNLKSLINLNGIDNLKIQKDKNKKEFLEYIESSKIQKEEKSFNECLKLIILIQKYYSTIVKEVKINNSFIFSSKIEINSMVLQQYSSRQSGNQSCEIKDQKNNLPLYQVIVPTKNKVESEHYKLRIPSSIINAFLSTPKDYYYLLALDGTSLNNLFFFKKKKKKPWDKEKVENMIKILDESLLDDFSARLDKLSYSLSFLKLNIVSDKIEFSYNQSSIYLKVPQIFFQLKKADTVLIAKNTDQPKVPAYSLSYDLYGNLVYSRVMYAENSIHNKQPFDMVLLDDVPNDSQNLNDFKVENLEPEKELLEIIKNR